MVKLIVGRKGTGKTKMMVDAANQASQEKDGSIVFIIKDDRLKHDLDREIRMIVMDEFEYVTNIDEYIGFIYGIISSNYDIQEIFIDSILKHADITVRDLPDFLKKLQNISEKYSIDFMVSLSADLEDLDASVRQYEIINKYSVLNQKTIIAVSIKRRLFLYHLYHVVSRPVPRTGR